jgi:rhamnogalacturonan endolyase
MDIEVRYALERGDSGIYAYAIFSHGPIIRRDGEGESRYITKLNHDFNWISVDADRNMLECTPQDWGAGVVIHAKEQRILSTGNYYKNSVEHKYSYNAVQYKIPAYGWSSTKDHIGVWFINPTTEYLRRRLQAGTGLPFRRQRRPRPDHPRLLVRRPLRRRRRLQHPAGENWNKVIGPIFVYCNALANPKTPRRPTSPRWPPPPATPPCRPPGRTTPPPLSGRALAQAKMKKPSGPTTGSTAWTIRTRMSAAP